MLIEYHRNMLSDKTRHKAFHAALKSVIRKGKTDVADIGSGTGVLGFMASGLGAKNVYLYEHAPVIELSRILAEANGIKNLHFINEHSAAVQDAPPVDVIVTETLGNMAFEEQTIETIEDARRFLKPGGTIIPGRISHYVCPVVSARFHKEMCVWDKVGYDIDFTAAKQFTLNNIYVRTFTKDDLMSGGKVARKWDTVDFSVPGNTSTRQGQASWKFSAPQTVYGYAVWWDAELVKGVGLSTSPLKPKTHWEQLYFPLLEPLKLRKGDSISVSLSSETTYEEGTIVRWDTTATGKSGDVRTQSQDLARGYLG